MSENPNEYLENIFCAIKRVWEDIGATIPEDINDRIDENLKSSKIWDDIDLTDVFNRMAHEFGLQCSFKEWMNFIGIKDGITLEEWEKEVSPQFTFRRTCEFFAERVPQISLGPRVIFGKSCGPGGAYLGIAEIMEAMELKVEKFGPGTKILDRLRGSELDRLYQRLIWMTSDALPPLRTTFLTVLRGIVWLGGFLSLAGLAWKSDHGGLVVVLIYIFFIFFSCKFSLKNIWECVLKSAAAIIFIIVILVLKDDPNALFVFLSLLSPVIAWQINKLLKYLDNRLPVGIVTFGDLARLIDEVEGKKVL